jgi:flagellar hook-associated protein 2
MSIAPLVFTGLSKFSSDFQTIIDRAVSIAKLPVSAIENRQADLTQQKLLVANMGTAVGSLASSVGSLAALGESQGLVATSSNTSKVTATATAAAGAAYYAITDITSIARAAAETSVSGYATGDATAVSATGTMELTVGAETRTITLTPETNNLTGLRDAINDLGLGVTATVLTTGTSTNSYYLSVSASATGATTLKLTDDPAGAKTAILTTANQGANTEFKLNGVSVSKPGTLISDVVPGLTLVINDKTSVGETVGITIAADRSKLASALQGLVNAYNGAASQVNGQIGPGAGLLSGDSLVRDVRNAMLSLVNYTGEGDIQTLTELGIELSNTGQMSFNSDTFGALTSDQVSQAFEFLGSATTGLGRVKQVFTAISDPITGTARIQEDQIDATNKRLGEQVDAMTARISIMQLSLRAKLQQADTLLASLDSQQTLLTASVESLTFSSFGKRSNG